MIKKQFSKSKPVCKATFTLSPEGAKTVALVGEFNGWDTQNPIAMKKQKDGTFKTTVELETGKAYEFRYLINGETWANDDNADTFVPSPFGTQNSVVILN